jgi:hypothetical protein
MAHMSWTVTTWDYRRRRIDGSPSLVQTIHPTQRRAQAAINAIRAADPSGQIVITIAQTRAPPPAGQSDFGFASGGPPRLTA